MTSPCVLILPGWQGSGPDHWQSRWERIYGYARVEQHDWMRPLRGDWTVQLEEAVLASPGPVVLVAHSLGCALASWWAAHSRHARRVRGALLVAPPELGRDDLRQQLPGWAPYARERLPFPAVVVASRDDPCCSFEKAQSLADSWGARFIDLGERGHINVESGLGDWPDGMALLQPLLGHVTPGEAV